MKRFAFFCLLLSMLFFIRESPADVQVVAGDDGPPALAGDGPDPLFVPSYYVAAAPRKKAASDCDCDPCTCKNCSCNSAYDQACEAAIRDDVALVVFVGQPIRYVPGALSLWQPRFPGCDGSCVVVSKPSNGKLWRLKDLAGSANVGAIQQALGNQPAVAAPPPPPVFFGGGCGPGGCPVGGGCAGGCCGR